MKKMFVGYGSEYIKGIIEGLFTASPEVRRVARLGNREIIESSKNETLNPFMIDIEIRNW